MPNMTTGYLRYPHVHGDRIAFVADDDIWLAPLSGGAAQRVTSLGAPCRTPFFSPDGSQLAFTSADGGTMDAYLLDIASGELTRLTWLGDSASSCRVIGWADPDHVLIASAMRAGYGRLTSLYTVDGERRIEALNLGPAMGYARGPQGQIALNSPNGRDSAMWKRYRGGTASRLWLDPTGAGDWQIVLPDEPAGKYAPSWVGQRLIFSSDLGAGRRQITDPQAQAQLWSVDATGVDLRQHTHHTAAEGYVRDPSTDGTTIVYHARGTIYAMAGLDAEAHPVEIDVGLGAPGPVVLEPTNRLEVVVPDHGGDGSLIEWRGAAYFLTHRAGPARALSAMPGVRIREPQILGRTGRGVWATDAEGEDALEIMPLTAGADPERIAQAQLGRVLHLAADPAGERVAVASHDGRVSLVDLSGTVTELYRAAEGEVTGLAWSPDGRWLIWRAGIGDEVPGSHLVLSDTRADQPSAVEVTAGTFDDSDPAFTPDGKYLVLLSSRTFEPYYDEHSFDMAFSRSVRPWLIPLKADQPAPFGLSVDGWQISELHEGEPDEQDKSERKKELVSVEIDLDGFEERMVPFPVPSDEYGQLRVVKDGVTWLRNRGGTGVLGANRAGAEGEPEGDALERFSFPARRVEVLAERVDDYAVSGDGERVVVRIKDELLVLPTDHRIEEDDDPSRVKVDLSRLRRQIRPRDEWRQMFDENGRLMAEHYWRPDMDGTDWQAVLANYRPLVEKLFSQDDLIDLLWETVAELNTSHAYVSAPEDPDLMGRRVGLLGADLDRNEQGEVVLARIIPGESSDPKAWSPLRAAGVAARAGDVVVAVDGSPVVDAPALGALLEGAVGKPVELALRTADQPVRRVAVRPLAEEETIRYHDWVATCRGYVEEHSQGRLGYVHVPDMMGGGWAQLHRQIETATRYEGVILDVRFNRGGHTSPLVLERFSRRVLGWDYGRYFQTPVTYPRQALRGPLVLVCNQWAGSDGDIINAAAQGAGLGPVVGERTWGGVIGIDGRFDLVDGTEVTQPRYTSWFAKHEWGLENHGVDPDVEVILTPADWVSGQDRQLDVAISLALEELRSHPAAQPPEFPAPRFGGR